MQVRVNRLHLSSAFLNQWPLKALYNIDQHSPIHTHIHTLTVASTMQGDSQLVKSSQGERRLAQGHYDTPLGVHQTSNLLVTCRTLYLLGLAEPL